MIRVRVPATSANLGPGFDALGVALSLYNYYELEEADGLRIEGCPPELVGPDNLFVVAFKRGLAELGLPFRGLSLRIDASIPIARGLGSSAACIVGGLLAASALAAGGDSGGLSRERILDLAAELEGHPDNAAPAVLGGFCAAVLSGRHVEAVRADVGGELVFHALVPPFPLSTKVARAALPKELAFADAVYGVGRSALVAAAFVSGRYEALATACSDRLHEPWRAPLISGFGEVVAAAKEAGCLAVYLSGAGPTIMALELERGSVPGMPRDALAAVLDKALASQRPDPWRRIRLRADAAGAQIERRERRG